MAHGEPCLMVEVVYAEPGRQVLCSVALLPGSTIQDAIERSGIMRSMTAADIERCKVGVFGKVRSRDTAVQDGDRVEIYRSLSTDPKDARRTRARGKPRTGGGR